MHTNTPSTSERGSQETIARQHGVDINLVKPHSRQQRLDQLRTILDNKNVPHPIGQQAARACYSLAESGKPFAIGSLSHQTADLATFADQQVYESLSPDDHLSWACLVADQQKSKQQYACREYLHGEELFDIGGLVIPDYYCLNARIYQQTEWQLATVNKIIPAEIFFDCHSRKFFPVTTFMRPLGTDYLQEPDIGHDVAGHVATFTIPQVAQIMNNHGLANNLIHHEKDRKLRSATTAAEFHEIEEDTRELLLLAGRLYWFTVEFGLVLQDGKLRAFGAGILSSPGETRYSIDSPDSNRILIDPEKDRDLLRLATTDYLISEYQKTYFVMKNFRSLASLTPQRILHVIHTARKLPHHTWREVVPGDDVIDVGSTMTSANEKYYRLISDQLVDECLERTAIRNLRMYHQGLELDNQLAVGFVGKLPPVPQQLIAEFAESDQRGEHELL